MWRSRISWLPDGCGSTQSASSTPESDLRAPPPPSPSCTSPECCCAKAANMAGATLCKRSASPRRGAGATGNTQKGCGHGPAQVFGAPQSSWKSETPDFWCAPWPSRAQPHALWGETRREPGSVWGVSAPQGRPRASTKAMKSRLQLLTTSAAASRRHSIDWTKGDVVKHACAESILHLWWAAPDATH